MPQAAVKSEALKLNENTSLVALPEGIISLRGNTGLFALNRIGFFASNTASQKVLKACEEWVASIPKGSCIISGFLSKPERVVLDKCLELGVPAIWVLACGITYKGNYLRYEKAIEGGTLLKASLFGDEVCCEIRENALTRNRFIADNCDIIIVGSMKQGGMTDTLLSSYEYTFI